MNAEILSVGTEILLGDIVNTNAQFLAKELASIGISVFRQTVVGDNPDRLLMALEEAFSRAEIVITTGGLGPTKDDLTKEIGGKFFDKKMIEDAEAMKTLKAHFASMGRAMTENNLKQAWIPEGSVVIPNSNGTAPGSLIEENGKILIMLPGPPSEMIPMYQNFVLPFLSQKTNKKYISNTLRLCGVGESFAEDKIKDIIENQTNPTIAPYAEASELKFRITAAATDENEAKKLIKPIKDELYCRFSENIYGEDDTSLVEVVIGLLEKNGLAISVAESCTGGMIASKFVDIPNVSSIFKEGIVAYSNEAKINRLGVSESTLNEFGAVSEQTAEEMARCVAKSSKTSVSIATTGIAGPDGGTDEKPVGLVYIAVFINGNVIVKEFNFKGNRQRIRERTAINALDTLRRELLKTT
ncbi:MAG: competence/damage-inducible protein A [Defluviitaleaceae bacterium]|nr:competence/damage-inducible protein A [Defluviitaleaceae bacterium]